MIALGPALVEPPGQWGTDSSPDSEGLRGQGWDAGGTSRADFGKDRGLGGSTWR